MARVSRWLAIAFGTLTSPLAADIFVGSNDSILSFYNFDNANATPHRVITGGKTGLDGVVALALDVVHREIWASNVDNNDVLVFDMDANGDVAPLRQITAAALITPRGIVLDLAHDEVYIVDFQADAVFVFPRTQNDDAAPLRTLTGIQSGLDGPVFGFLDLVHDELYVSNFGGTLPRVAVFDRSSANGDVPPLRTLEGLVAGIENPRSIYVDLPTDLMIVAEYDLGAIRVYPRTAITGTPFLHELTGPTTALTHPYQIAVNTFGELIIGIDTSVTSRVVVHAATSEGDHAPERVLVGVDTQLFAPTGVATDFARNCSWGNSVDGCVFRDNFESGVFCYWNEIQGGAACP